jgi:general secretion pathway protein B
MSYILEALKKADQQRQRGVPPTLLTVQAVAAYQRPRFPRNAAIVAVLLCVVIVVGWLRPWQAEKSVTEPVATHTPAPSSHAAVPAPTPQPSQMAGALEQVPVAQTSTPSGRFVSQSGDAAMQGETPPLAHTGPRATLAPADTVVPQETAGPSADKKELASPADAGPGRRVVALNELPPSLQQEIPNISIAFHVYSSKPKDRRVMINGEMVGQGEQLASGLSLEEITPDGVIFGYKGYRFRRAVR